MRQAYFRLARTHTPEDDAARFQRIAEAYRVLSDPDARRRYDSEERLPPAAAAALSEASRLAAAKPEEAAATAAKVLASWTSSPLATFAAACLLLRLERAGEALPALERLCRSGAPKAEHLGALGRAYLHCKRLDEAQRALDRAVALDPSQPGAWLALADVSDARGDTEKAIDALDRGIRSDGKSDLRDLPLQLRKICLLVQFPRWDAMDGVVREITAVLPPGDPEAAQYVAGRFCELAQECAEAGAYDVARFAVESARRIAPHPDLDAWSAKLAPFSAGARQCRTAFRDPRVAQWIRNLLPPQFGNRMPDERWEELCNAAVRSVSRRLLNADADWAAFRKLYPDGAARLAETWKQIREAAAGAGKGARRAERRSTTGAGLAVSVLMGIVALLVSTSFRTCNSRSSAKDDYKVYMDRLLRDANRTVEDHLSRMTPEERKQFFDEIRQRGRGSWGRPSPQTPPPEPK